MCKLYTYTQCQCIQALFSPRMNLVTYCLLSFLNVSFLPKVVFITDLFYLLCYSEEDYLPASEVGDRSTSYHHCLQLLKTMGKHSLGPSGTSCVANSTSHDQSCDIQRITQPVVWHSAHHATSRVTFSASRDQSCDIQRITRPVVWHSAHHATSRVTFSASRDQSCDIQCIMQPVVTI